MTANTPTVTLEMLKRFCATEGEDPRDYLYAPMHIEGWLCATNSHVVVGIAPTASNGQASAAPTAIVNGIRPIRQMWEKVTDEQWRPWTELIRSTQTPPSCECCKGSGWVTITQCDHCEGDGEFEHKGLHYDCQNCDQEGAHWHPATTQTPAAMPCQDCEGLGVVWAGLEARMPDIDHFGLQERYASQLQDYPGIEWALPRHSDTDCGAIPIRFNGGWGAVMPLLLKSETAKA